MQTTGDADKTADTILALERGAMERWNTGMSKAAWSSTLKR